MVTQRELEKLFQNKHVGGVVDACHAGGLEGFSPTKGTRAASLVLSCHSDETSSDSFNSNLNTREFELLRELSQAKNRYRIQIDQLEDVKIRLKLLRSLHAFVEQEISEKEFLSIFHASLNDTKPLVPFLEPLIRAQKQVRKEVREENEVKGGALVHYIFGSNPKNLDVDKNGIVSYREMFQALPQELVGFQGKQKPLSTASEFCDPRIEKKFGIPLSSWPKGIHRPLGLNKAASTEH